MNSSRPSAFTRLCARVVVVALIVQPIGAYAAPITTSSLAQVPLQGLNPVKPNIMFTLDDSASMNAEFVPDFVAEGAPGAQYCRDNQLCGFFRVDFAFISTSDPPFRSSDFNAQHYDPSAIYVPGRRADSSDLPYEAANAGTGTSVFVNGFAGYPGANSGGTINLTTSYPDTAWCNTQAGQPPSPADTATAFGDGSKCRLNGRTYASFAQFSGASIDWTAPAVAWGFNYPNSKSVSTGSNTLCQSANEYCVFSTPAAVSANPYYYRISKVQFCSSADGGGFGTTPCQDRWDRSTFKFVRYGTDPAKSFDPQAFTRVDIKSTGFLVNGVSASNPSGRSYAEEMTNFAKWYAFNRTRILAMKTASGFAFSRLSEENARVGFHTLAENASLFLNVRAFDGGHKANWFEKFYAVNPQGLTPLPDAIFRVGEYFSNSGNSGLPGAIDPLDATTGKCQRNFHLMSTDGYWNFALNPANGSVGDRDRTVPGSLPGPIPGFTPGSSFPPPYYEGSASSSNSLSDLSMKYWINDIRPNVDNNVQDGIAPWQHVTLYGLTIGVQGNIVFPTGLDAIVAGTKDWPQPLGNGGPDSVDDLWHATLNSRGKFLNANSPQQLAESIVSAVADFTSTQSGTGTAVGIAGAQFSATRKYGYRTSYEVGWWGDVRKYALDSATGALPIDANGNPKNAPVWSAATQLDALAAGTGWDTNRRIVTAMNDGKPIPFRLASLEASQTDSLKDAWKDAGPIRPTEQQMLNYLRGDKSNEGTGTTNFRIRTHTLGDIVYSGAVPVGAPGQPYDEAGNPGYTAFALSKQARTPMIYVGGNDGMVHAFNDSACQNPQKCLPTEDAGKEAWAYVPSVLFKGEDPNDTEHEASSKFSLAALTYRPGGIPLFEHKFYVNATPRVWDIDFANTNTKTPPTTGNDWRTILVGGLGAGGRSVYALDVTTPVVPLESEAEIAASGRVLWEFKDDKLGYLFDAPTLVKTKRYGWVVLVASGYNNGDGKGRLFVLNPTDGTKLRTLETDVGSKEDPSGLSTIRAYTSSRKDPYVLQAYGGDLKGNVWRFDLSDPDEGNWKVELIAKLTDASGKAQPITTGVRVEIDQNNNVDRYLFVGTGKLLDQPDLSDNSITNTLYVIRDGTRTATEAAPVTPYSRADLNRVDGSQVGGISGTPTGRGWYQDASDPAEKIGTDVYADVQTVVYSFSKPGSDPCQSVLTSRLFARDLNSGSSVLQSTGGAVVPSIDDIGAIAGVGLIQGEGGVAGASSGEVRVQVTTLRGQVLSFGVKLTGSAASKHRVSWRLLNRD